MPQTTTYHVKVKNIIFTETLFKYQKRRVILNQKITGLKQNSPNNYIETDVDYFDIPFELLLKQSLANIESLTTFYIKKEKQATPNAPMAFGTAELSAVLQHADLTIERIKHFAGEKYTLFNGATSIYQYDWYETIITSIKITPQMQQLLDKAINEFPPTLKTNTQLPDYLEHYVFDELKAQYTPDFERAKNNLYSEHSDNLKYLGTYFPRSYAETFCIFDNLFQNQIIKQTYELKQTVKILSVGCGTGGDTIGLLTAINKHFSHICSFHITAIDGNADALEILNSIIEEFRRFSHKTIFLDRKNIVFQDLKTVVSLKPSFDFILNSKMINELRNDQEPYYDFSKAWLPLLSETGLFMLLDTTNPKEETSLYNSMLMNTQINKALKELPQYQTLLPIPCNLIPTCDEINCFTQKEFIITHSRYPYYDKSKVAYRILCNRSFANSIGYCQDDKRYLIHNNNPCPYTQYNTSSADAYLLTTTE